MAVKLNIDAIERDHANLDVTEIVTWLDEHLGQRMTAYVSGIKDQKLVAKWASGKHKPHPDSEMRLRRAYYAARLIVEAYSDQTARAWLFGANTRLDDQAPASVLRTAAEVDDLFPIVPAARAFAAHAA